MGSPISNLVKTQESVLQATLERESLLDKISNSKKQIKQAESQLINAEIELEAAKSKHEEVGDRLFSDHWFFTYFPYSANFTNWVL